MTAPAIDSPILIVTWAILALTLPGGWAHAQTAEPPGEHRHYLETYPIMALFDVYSVQYARRVSDRGEVILGLAYVNVEVRDRDDQVIGRMHAPTLPVGLRWYVWGKAHVEYQLWPAYNAYHDQVGERYHRGFDLYNELRVGYRVDFTLRGAHEA